MRSHAQIIEEFGGIPAFARAIGVHPQLAVHWGKRGIPAKYWHLVEKTELARKLGITACVLSALPVGTDRVAA